MFVKSDIVCLKFLGKGPFFEEYLVSAGLECARSARFSLRAMKKTLITLSETDEEMVMLELKIRSKIRHPFLINQICAFQDYNNLYYISEYAPTPLLKSDILPRKFAPEITKFYIAEAFLCLRYLHSRGQTYTFLSQKNILLAADGHIKLDYSFCNCIEYSGNIMDDVEYLSPDYLENNRFGYASDYWSLGIVMYQMLHGYTPFQSSSTVLTIAEIKKGNIVIQEPVDENTHNMINMLIDKNISEKYPDCKAFEDAVMNHPLFFDINWQMLENKEYEPPYLIRLPDYDTRGSPKLGMLYTSDYIVGEKDGYGNIFKGYNTVHFLKKRSRGS